MKVPRYGETFHRKTVSLEDHGEGLEGGEFAGASFVLAGLTRMIDFELYMKVGSTWVLTAGGSPFGFGSAIPKKSVFTFERLMKRSASPASPVPRSQA